MNSNLRQKLIVLGVFAVIGVTLTYYVSLWQSAMSRRDLLKELFEEKNGDPEWGLIQKIQSSSGEERDRLISEVETLPQTWWSFHQRWQWIHLHGKNPYAGWSDTGYDPTRCVLPRDIQLLAASKFGKDDIENGGLHQFFTNSTGQFAPEMVEWFDRTGQPQVASCLREAMAIFGEKFPRSRAERQEFLSKFPGETRDEFDPFVKIDDRLMPSFPETPQFDDICNRWLRETCGIHDLHDEP